MNKRINLTSEGAWLLGLLTVTLGVALVTKSGFGVSMVVAPAYILAQKLGITFGVAEYLLQGFVFLLYCVILRRLRLFDLFTVVTVLVYGAVLNVWLALLRGVAPASLPARCLSLLLGAFFTALGIAFLFRTYLAPQAYELLVKGLSQRFRRKMETVKIVYDVSSLALSVLMALLLFGGFRNGDAWLIGPGTVFCTLSNSIFIGLSGKLLDRFFVFDAYFPKLGARFS